ncbi:2106_t:CDS:2, partial [Racocetra persica]
WLDIMLYLPDDDEGLDIRKKFLDADNAIQTFPIVPPKHPDSMYTRKAINTQEIKDFIGDNL